MSDTVKVTINGAEYEFPPGLTILQAAREVGIRIPYFCWHKHLSLSGNCRMCLVEVKPGPPKPAIACGTVISDGMEVVTNSEKIVETRKAVLQFLLLNHPLDCPVCDEAYECKLQDYVYEYGPTVSRFVDFHDKKRVYKREDLGKMWVEMNRCIQCTRCVRYLKEIAGEYEMDRTHRGHHLKIDTYKEAFESDFALNAADLCPVGALEDKKFHFKTRTWDLRRGPSICPGCSIGCNIYIDWFGGRIERLLPRENDAVNACWICDHGRHDFDCINENRLQKPRVRSGANLEDARYSDALARAKKDLDEIRNIHGPDAVALLLSPRMTNEELFLGKKLGQVLGTERVAFLAGYNHRPVVPVMSDVLPKTLVSDDKTPNSTGGRLLGIHEGKEDFTAAHELVAAIEDGKVKGLMLFHEDLSALSSIDGAALKKALGLLDFFMVVAIRDLAVAEQAHVVLPTLSYAEKDGSFTNHQKRVQRIFPVLPPLSGVKSELEILTELGRMFDASFGYENAAKAFDAMAAEEGAFSGLSLEALGEDGLEAKEG